MWVYDLGGGTSRKGNTKTKIDKPSFYCFVLKKKNKRAISEKTKFEVSFISEEEDEGASGKGKNESCDTAFTTFSNRI